VALDGETETDRPSMVGLFPRKNNFETGTDLRIATRIQRKYDRSFDEATDSWESGAVVGSDPLQGPNGELKMSLMFACKICMHAGMFTTMHAY
jgi:hypothetical protein